MNDHLKTLLSEFSGPPVNIEGVIRGLGLELDKKAELDSNISGQIAALASGKFRISANKSDNYFRQRFTMAHELAHFLLHRDLIGTGLDDDRAYRSTEVGKYHNKAVGVREETEANRVAAQILMPAQLVREEFRDAPDVSALATRFQVSRQAMEIRLQTLKLEFA